MRDALIISRPNLPDVTVMPPLTGGFYVTFVVEAGTLVVQHVVGDVRVNVMAFAPGQWSRATWQFEDGA